MAGATSGSGLDCSGMAHHRFRLGSDGGRGNRESIGSRCILTGLAQIAHQRRKEFSSSRPITQRSSPRGDRWLTNMTAFVAVAQKRKLHRRGKTS